MTPRQWWRRAAAAAKDRRSLCLARLGPLPPPRSEAVALESGSFSLRHHPELEAAVIKATSHDESRMDYKNAGRVFAWARTSPEAFSRPLMRALTRRVEKTRCWAVALKALILVHGVLLCCRKAFTGTGRLPFDLSAFRDRSSWGLSAFVRAYFNFLDQRSVFLAHGDSGEADLRPEEEALRQVGRMQDMLELLMQVRPYGDEGSGARLLLEAMDCVVVEIFDVYGSICSGIASYLTAIFDSPAHPSTCSTSAASDLSSSSSDARMFGRPESGAVGVRVLRRSTEQSSRLASYFDLCRRLGVLNAAELPPVERIPDEDIDEIEAMLLLGEGAMPGTPDNGDGKERGRPIDTGTEMPPRAEEDGEKKKGRVGTVVTRDWVVFEDELGDAAAAASSRNRVGDTVATCQNGLLGFMVEQRPSPHNRGCRSPLVYAGPCGLVSGIYEQSLI